MKNSQVNYQLKKEQELASAEIKAVNALKKAQKDAVAEVKKDPAAAMKRLFGDV